ncbi:hypothetical protein KIPB_013742 [Kipferlia bialata]|uniref:Uncharacterized protein n=1 Tax=Kipferlia bialata TaxID=797122 RepID=A0A9K3GPR2_9EUKA|nr:hypothetical protein KIPB_013742 [Kipferlia bialata]|eukprot:g13742.t1
MLLHVPIMVVGDSQKVPTAPSDNGWALRTLFLRPHYTPVTPVSEAPASDKATSEQEREREREVQGTWGSEEEDDLDPTQVSPPAVVGGVFPHSGDKRKHQGKLEVYCTRPTSYMLNCDQPYVDVVFEASQSYLEINHSYLEIDHVL